MASATRVCGAVVIAVLALAIVAPRVVSAQEVEAHSFRPPFTEFDANFGHRRIPRWMIGGSADLNENFLRLTPDRASKRGYAWHTEEIGMDHFTTSVYFRVSGQGQNLFGDGFAVWFTDSERYREGSLHGFTDTFKGFGVIFDTFRNLESGHVHKDVAVVFNDGTGPVKLDSGVEPQGCDGDFRYHEGRDDFSVHARSGAAITLNNGVLSIRLDTSASGDWKDCVTSYRIPLEGDWHKRLFMGITASTGQLADNHDIIAVITSAGNAIAPETLSVELPALSTGNPQVDAAIKTALAKENALIKEKLQHMHHHVEHQVEAMKDSIKHTIKKLREQEEDNKRRIELLEAQLDVKVSDKLDNRLQDRIAALETKLGESMDAKVAQQLPGIAKQVASEVDSSGGGWVWPFVFLLLIFLGFIAWAVSYFKRVEKRSHLL